MSEITTQDCSQEYRAMKNDVQKQVEALTVPQILSLMEGAGLNDCGHAAFGLNDIDRKTLCAFVHTALRANTDAQSVDVESLKREVIKACEHPNDGTINGIASRRKGIEDAIAYLAPRLQGVPEGYVLVPREPTGRMLCELYAPIREYVEENCPTLVIEKGYKAMIAAAQTEEE